MSSISAGLTTTTGLVYVSDSSGSLVLKTNGGTTAVTITTAQRVLVGSSTTPGANPSLLLNGNATYTEGSIQFGSNSTGGGYIQSNSGAGLNFYTYTGSVGSETYTSRMTLDGNGNLAIGQTSSDYQNSNSAYFGINTANRGYLILNHVSGSSSGNVYVGFGYNGTAIGSITQSGTTGVLYNITSDQRLKENIVDAPDASADIDAIKVRSFDFISDKSPVKYGFIAQELVTVAPDAVHQPSNPEEMMGVDYSKLVPMMLKEIQSLRARLKAANIA